MSWDDTDDSGFNFGEEKELTPEDIFSMVMVNKIKGVKLNAELRDENGEVISLAEVIEDLLEWTKDKLTSEEENQFTSQIYPLMAQAMASGLSRFVGIQQAGFWLANEVSRTSFIHMMALSFLLLKYVQQHKLTIHTIEESVSKEDIAALEDRAQANNDTVMGLSMKESLKKLIESGKITREDLKEALGEDESTED